MPMPMRVFGGLILAVFSIPAPSGAEVTDRSANGFTIRVVTEIAAPRDAVWAALVRVQDWWDREHTYSGDSRNLSIDARPGGCFCETLPNRGGVEHAVVVNVQPGSMLRMRGALGPLQEGGIAGSLTWQLEASGQDTRLVFTHVAGGYVPGGLEKLADAVDMVLAHQVERLKSHAERTRR